MLLFNTLILVAISITPSLANSYSCNSGVVGEVVPYLKAYPVAVDFCAQAYPIPCTTAAKVRRAPTTTTMAGKSATSSSKTTTAKNAKESAWAKALAQAQTVLKDICYCLQTAKPCKTSSTTTTSSTTSSSSSSSSTTESTTSSSSSTSSSSTSSTTPVTVIITTTAYVACGTRTTGADATATVTSCSGPTYRCFVGGGNPYSSCYSFTTTTMGIGGLCNSAFVFTVGGAVTSSVCSPGLTCLPVLGTSSCIG